jgi:membrane protein YdbS with pleckstrin-like domain
MEMLLLIIVLFVMAILSVWIFPNSKFSNNRHDVEN